MSKLKNFVKMTAWITATAATGGLALALVPTDWDGIDGYDDGDE
tara:strand:- start:330 stop:461 length:132 start_codon:yes stop_codon:yes gene_type:complete